MTNKNQHQNKERKKTQTSRMILENRIYIIHGSYQNYARNLKMNY